MTPTLLTPIFGIKKKKRTHENGCSDLELFGKLTPAYICKNMDIQQLVYQLSSIHSLLSAVRMIRTLTLQPYSLWTAAVDRTTVRHITGEQFFGNLKTHLLLAQVFSMHIII